MQTKDLCIKLAKEAGVPGDEGRIAHVAKELLGKYMPVETDRMGNVTGRIVGEGKHILLDAHMDRIGFIVRGINDKGFVLFDKCGHIDARTLIGAEVEIFGKERLFGVVSSTPPHLSDNDKKAPDISRMAIDIGLSKEAAEKLIFPGDRGIIKAEPCLMGNDLVCGGGLDNRAGMAVLIKAVEYLREMNVSPNLTVMFSSQEEVGCRGAATGAFTSEADEAIVVDVSFAVEPGVPKEDGGELGKGPMIGFAAVLDREISERLTDICSNKGIPFQREVMSRSTGTNADSISVSGKGIKTGLISVPLRNMHTSVEVIDAKDVDNCGRLIAEYIALWGGKENV